MSREKFGREHFEEAAGGVRNAEDAVARGGELTKDLKKNLRKPRQRRSLPRGHH